MLHESFVLNVLHELRIQNGVSVLIDFDALHHAEGTEKS